MWLQVSSKMLGRPLQQRHTFLALPGRLAEDWLQTGTGGQNINTGPWTNTSSDEGFSFVIKAPKADLSCPPPLLHVEKVHYPSPQLPDEKCIATT